MTLEVPIAYHLFTLGLAFNHLAAGLDAVQVTRNFNRYYISQTVPTKFLCCNTFRNRNTNVGVEVEFLQHKTCLIILLLLLGIAPY